MAHKVKQEAVLHATESAYIDPLNCNSTVSYKISTDSYARLSAEVELADCNRKINWYFDGDKSGVAKMDAAIAMLKRFRTALATEQAKVAKKAKAS